MDGAVVNLRWGPWLAVWRRTAIYDPSADLPLWAMNLMVVALYLGIGGRLVWLDRRHGSTA